MNRMIINLLVAASLVLILNLPFGYWRANVEKFSLQWFLAIHSPVPFVVALRFFSGLGWQLITFPVLIGVFFFGQFLGGGVHFLWRKHGLMPATSCLVWDVVRKITSSEM